MSWAPWLLLASASRIWGPYCSHDRRRLTLSEESKILPLFVLSMLLLLVQLSTHELLAMLYI